MRLVLPSLVFTATLFLALPAYASCLNEAVQAEIQQMYTSLETEKGDRDYWHRELKKLELLVPEENEDYFSLWVKMSIAARLEQVLEEDHKHDELETLRQKYPHPAEVQNLLESVFARQEEGILPGVEELGAIGKQLSSLLDERRFALVNVGLYLDVALSRTMNAFFLRNMTEAEALYAALDTEEILALGCKVSQEHLFLLQAFINQYNEEGKETDLDALRHYYAIVWEGIERNLFPPARSAATILDTIPLFLKAELLDEAEACFLQMLQLHDDPSPTTSRLMGYDWDHSTTHRVREYQIEAAKMLISAYDEDANEAAAERIYTTMGAHLGNDPLGQALLTSLATHYMIAGEMDAHRWYTILHDLPLPELIVLSEKDACGLPYEDTLVCSAIVRHRNNYYSFYEIAMMGALVKNNIPIARQLLEDSAAWPEEELARTTRQSMEEQLAQKLEAQGR